MKRKLYQSFELFTLLLILLNGGSLTTLVILCKVVEARHGGNMEFYTEPLDVDIIVARQLCKPRYLDLLILLTKLVKVDD